jgi:hypothetical protein
MLRGRRVLNINEIRLGERSRLRTSSGESFLAKGDEYLSERDRVQQGADVAGELASGALDTTEERVTGMTAVGVAGVASQPGSVGIETLQSSEQTMSLYKRETYLEGQATRNARSVNVGRLVLLQRVRPDRSAVSVVLTNRERVLMPLGGSSRSVRSVGPRYRPTGLGRRVGRYNRNGVGRANSYEGARREIHAGLRLVLFF